MQRTDFISHLDQAAIEESISKAEQLTSGEIRVMIVDEAAPDPVAAATRAFQSLGMTATRDRNAVLFYIAPVSQSFAVIGDEGVHRCCGESFWKEVAHVMTDHFKLGHYTAGLKHGIARAGVLLAQHFPRKSDDKDELPNTVVRPVV
jgi:uncharacterized membrane protein